MSAQQAIEKAEVTVAGNEADVAAADAPSTDAVDAPPLPLRHRRFRIHWSRALAYVVLPALALLLAIAAGYAKWVYSSYEAAAAARVESVRVATDGAVAMLSYKPDTVEKDLGVAQERLTGSLRDSYSSLIRDVVIPGAEDKQISTVATVPAAASVSATQGHAVVLVFVNQSITMGAAAPTITASSIRITLDKLDDRWMISGFDPV